MTPNAKRQTTQRPSLVQIWTIAVVSLMCISAATILTVNTNQLSIPDTAIINAGMLADAKQRVLQGEAQVALDTLVARSNGFLASEVVSVMDKQVEPPSGDFHDYITLAPYFWPNPDTPDGLPYVKRDGELHEPNRSGTDFYTRAQMEEAVITLGIAYYLTDDLRYAEGASKQIRAWFLTPETRMNPNLNFAQGVPGIMDGSLWGIIETWRWTAIIDVIRLIGGTEVWTVEDEKGMAAWFDEYQIWLRTSELGFDESLMWNNHGSFYDSQVASLALFAGKPQLARDILLEARNRRINHGIEPDGRQLYEQERTRSFGYSVFNLRAFFHLAALGEQVDVDLWNYRAEDGSGIRTSLDFLATYADPAQVWPYPDLKIDRTWLVPILRWAAYAYDEPEYLNRARMIPGYDSARSSFPQFVTDLPQLFLEN